jgi:hypothetical protein
MDSWSFTEWSSPQIYYTLVNDYQQGPFPTKMLALGEGGEIPYGLVGFAIGPVSRNMVAFQQSIYTQNSLAADSEGPLSEPVWGSLLNLLWLTKTSQDCYIFDMCGWLVTTRAARLCGWVQASVSRVH